MLNTPLQMFAVTLAGVPKPTSGPVARLERLGGGLSNYYRKATCSVDRILEQDEQYWQSRLQMAPPGLAKS
jgi:hypothetical protein